MTRPRSMEAAYGLLAIVGTAMPLLAIAPWLVEHGIDIRRLVAELFAARVSAFFGLDVIVSAVVLLLLIVVEARRSGIRHAWVAIAATVLIGVSCGLPLFLALRERARR